MVDICPSRDDAQPHLWENGRCSLCLTPQPSRNKEQVYDEDIFPLMKRIIEICQEHKIPMIAHYAIPTPKDKHLVVTTSLLSDEFLAPISKQHRNDLLAALSILKDGFIAYTRRIGG